MEGGGGGIDPDIPPEEAARSKSAARYTTSPALRNWPRKKDWTWTPPHAQRCANEACRLGRTERPLAAPLPSVSPAVRGWLVNALGHQSSGQGFHFWPRQGDAPFCFCLFVFSSFDSTLVRSCQCPSRLRVRSTHKDRRAR